MSTVTTIGVDIAKSVFQVHGIDAEGVVLIRRQVRRGQVLGIVNLSKSGRVEGVTTRPKLLKVRPGPWVRIPQSRANPVKLTVHYEEWSDVSEAMIGAAMRSLMFRRIAHS